MYYNTIVQFNNPNKYKKAISEHFNLKLNWN